VARRQFLRRRFNPLEKYLVFQGVRSGWPKRVTLQNMRQHPEVDQQDLSNVVGWIRETREFFSVHFVGGGIKGDELETGWNM
jgi:hypothetical protein